MYVHMHVAEIRTSFIHTQVVNPQQLGGKVYVVSANSKMIDNRVFPHYLGQLFLPGFRYSQRESE